MKHLFVENHQGRKVRKGTLLVENLNRRAGVPEWGRRSDKGRGGIPGRKNSGTHGCRGIGVPVYLGGCKGSAQD